MIHASDINYILVLKFFRNHKSVFSLGHFYSFLKLAATFHQGNFSAYKKLINTNHMRHIPRAFKKCNLYKQT